MARKIQYPLIKGNWLHNSANDYTRIFTDYILIDDTMSAWEECTTAEKEQWELEHPIPESIDEQIDVVQ